MATVATLTQVAQANMGQATPFTLAVQNTGGAAILVQGIQLTARTGNGQTPAPCVFGQITAFPAASSPQVNGSQFNVSIGAGATTYFNFSASFFGPGLKGGPTQPQNTFLVQAFVTDSVNGVTSSTQRQVILNAPIDGGLPENPAVSTGQLNFSTAQNSALAL